MAMPFTTKPKPYKQVRLQPRRQPVSKPAYKPTDFTPEMVDDDLKVQALADHLQRTCDILNEEFARDDGRGSVPIRFHMKTTPDQFLDLMNNTRTGKIIEAAAEALALGKSFTGLINDTQLRTLADIAKQIYHEPQKLVLCLGAMMCGKTGTGNACHWLGPIFFLLRGSKYYPMHLLPVRKANHEQSRDEFSLWLSIYQDLRIECTSSQQVVSLRDYRAPAIRLNRLFDRDGMPSLNTYRRHVMQDKLEEQLRTIRGRSAPRGQDIFDELIYRRATSAISPLRELCHAAHEDGFLVMYVIDEPHWGSAKGSVQARMLETFREILKHLGTEHMLICFDATPFEIVNADSFRVIYHRLGENYCGPNCFGGVVLDPSVTTKDVLVHRMVDYAAEVGVPDFALISRKAYKTEQAFYRWHDEWMKKHDVEWERLCAAVKPVTRSYKQYKTRVEHALRDTLHHVLLSEHKEERTRGVCVRFMDSNAASKQMFEGLGLDKSIKIIYYFHDGGTMSVKHAIEDAAPDGPYIIVVTGAGRMADWFPQHCSHFFDFTDFISNQVSLLQGSYGRACGYGEPRHVIMKDRGVAAIRAYLDSKGLDGLHPGRQVSTPLGMRGRPLWNVRLTSANCQKDPQAKALLKRFESEIIAKLPWIECDPENAMSELRAYLTRTRATFQPIWSIFSDDALRYIEANHKVLLPEVAQRPLILRPYVDQYDAKGRVNKIDIAPGVKGKQGFGKFGLRNWDEFTKKHSTSENTQSKGKFFGDRPKSDDKASRQRTSNTGRVLDESDPDTLRSQPQIWLTGDYVRKRWSIREIVFRLYESVRPVRTEQNDDGFIYPAKQNLYFDFLGELQKLTVDFRDDTREARTAQRKARRV